MGKHVIGVIMNGVTGRMGRNQHLVRSVLAIRERGGIQLPDGDVIWPEPVLVGRNEGKLRALAEAHQLQRWSTDLDACLADPGNQVYFDALTTQQRAPAVRRAIQAGKHVYCEKPVAANLDDALDLVRLARQVGVKTGVVQDKLFLPGIRKLARLLDSGFFGRVLSVKADFGYWVFDGIEQPAQRPSWNYRKEDGGGIVLDMFPHWCYLLEGLFGTVRSVSCLGVTHLPERADESGQRYAATAEDAAYATFTLDGGVIVQINASWCTRVHRDDLLVVQVDGTAGSAVAGLRDCWVQPAAVTPRAVWNPDLPSQARYRDQWIAVPDNQEFDNGFKIQWELFLKHVVLGEPFPWDFLAGARGIQLAELGLASWRERRWVDVPELQP